MHTHITDSNQFLGPLVKQVGQPLDLSILGNFEGTIVLQCAKQEDDWRPYRTYTGPVEDTVSRGTAWRWRLGVPAGSQFSGSALVGLY